jgi:RNA polymerase-binding transcription factor DksA
MSPTNRRYGTLKRLWEAGSLEVHRSIRVLLEGPSDPVPVTAPEELGPTNAERELDLAVLQLKAERCRRISDAMHRLEDGTFGCCETCGGRIPTARLRALPFADRCRSCQEREEAIQNRGRVPALVIQVAT